MSKRKCDENLYCTFLRVTSDRYTGLSLSEVAPNQLSHDSVSRWLKEVKYQPKQVWESVKKEVVGQDGYLIADETILNKDRSKKIELVRRQYSGTDHATIRGIGLLNFLWVDINHSNETPNVRPCDFRIYEPKEDGKTKNSHFREMLLLAKKRGIRPKAVLADTWYSSLKNLKCMQSLEWNWVVGLKKNRLVNRGKRLDELVIPEAGLCVHLQGYGSIHVFSVKENTGKIRYYGTTIDNPTRDAIIDLVKTRWNIEVYHRELKQTSGLERCQSRTSRAQRNHIAFAVLSWIKQAKLRNQFNVSMYQQQWDIIKGSIASKLKSELAYVA